MREDVAQALETSRTFNSTCTYLDEIDQVQLVKSTFFHLYCLKGFTCDTFASNKLRHFELILEHNGSKLSEDGEKAKVDVADMLEEINEKVFEDYLAASGRDRCTNPIPHICSSAPSKTKRNTQSLQRHPLEPLAV